MSTDIPPLCPIPDAAGKFHQCDCGSPFAVQFARAVVQEARELSGKIDPTAETHDTIAQVNAPYQPIWPGCSRRKTP